MEESRQINLDKYNNVLLTKEEGRAALLYGNDINGSIILDEQEVALFNKNSEQILGEAVRLSNPMPDSDLSVEGYHNTCSGLWDIPDKYSTLDMESYLLSLCKNEEETSRVEMEYAMFEERDLIPLLQFLMYIVEHMREHKIVWGVGRGSSVASYSLYLLGVHKVDSIKYDLPIEEFLK